MTGSTTLRVSYFYGVDMLAVTPPSTTLQPGETVQLTAIAHRPDGATYDATSMSIWTSADPSIARVDTAGLATAVSPGATTVTARIGTVVSPPVALTVR